MAIETIQEASKAMIGAYITIGWVSFAAMVAVVPFVGHLIQTARINNQINKVWDKAEYCSNREELVGYYHELLDIGEVAGKAIAGALKDAYSALERKLEPFIRDEVNNAVGQLNLSSLADIYSLDLKQFSPTYRETLAKNPDYS